MDLLESSTPPHILYSHPHRMHVFNRLIEEPFLREAHSLLIHIENGVGANEAMDIAATRKASIAPRHHGSYLWRGGFFPPKPKRAGPREVGPRLAFRRPVPARAVRPWAPIPRETGPSLPLP